MMLASLRMLEERGAHQTGHLWRKYESQPAVMGVMDLKEATVLCVCELHRPRRVLDYDDVSFSRPRLVDVFLAHRFTFLQKGYNLGVKIY